MISRLVTVDLILTTSLRLRQWKLLPFTDELELYATVREILNDWARNIEGLSINVSLGTIAENAVQLYHYSEGEPSWPRLINIGDQLIERAREIEGYILNRSPGLLFAPIQEEIAKAFKEGKAVSFTEAAMDITVLENPSEATGRLKEFLTWLRDQIVCDVESKAYQLLNDAVAQQNSLTTSAIELFKTHDYFPFFDSVFYGGRAEKRRQGHNRKNCS
jgi:hypothetical protein